MHDDLFFGLLQLYIEGYLQATLDTIYRQEYLRVRVIDNQVCRSGILELIKNFLYIFYD